MEDACKEGTKAQTSSLEVLTENGAGTEAEAGAGSGAGAGTAAGTEEKMKCQWHRWLLSTQVADAYQWTTANSKKWRAKNFTSSVNQ